MTMTDTRRPALRNDLYIRSEELPGTPAVDAEDPQDTENNADNLVRQLLIEEKRRTMPERLPDIVPQEEVFTRDAEEPEEQRESARESIAQILKAERAVVPEETARRRGLLRLPRLRMPSLPLKRLSLPRSRIAGARRQTVPEAHQSTPETKAAPAPYKSALRPARLAQYLPVSLRSYRPTKKHIAWAVVAALVLYRPLMVPLVALLLVWLVLIAYLTLGPDRWGEIIGGAWQRLHARKPELAERIRQRADRFAEKFDRVLDWLPDSWAERLALPDFSGADQSDDDRPDPFDRLAAEARQT
ncbi:hypothetical protein FIU86_03240 [Roseovarius sp. THAF9]|uniref:hypothetical protein n=1 Tax=Roseovarius sp. THAF9 TaxID=2587847 RepID=UPI0012690BAC|nr:hypothetical protein [Roseovarius sp. THAF9]QFT91841.1 hypothetical protein FIU86_03240 [Roseovarius sp. THAF9]